MPRQLLRLSAESSPAARRPAIGRVATAASWLAAAFFGSAPIANGETVDQALVYEPIQAGVAFDTPSKEDREKCTIEKEVQPKTEKVIGFIVKDPNGKMLRRFFDSDGDKKLDTWSYFKDGIEVYREHGPKPKTGDVVASEFRWLGENGTRFGIDTDANQKIDQWAAISPEEVSEEFLLTVKLKDAERFSALLISNEEVDSLPISAEMKEAIKTRAEKSQKDFASYVSKQKLIDSKSTWISFGGIKPMTLVLTDQGDVTVYENVSTIFDKDGDPKTNDDRADVSLGTLIHIVGQDVDAWRMIDLPEVNPISLSGLPTNGRTEEPSQPQASPANEAAIAKHFKAIEQMETKGPANAADFAALAKEYETVLGMIDGELYENTLIGFGQTIEQGASMADNAGKPLYPAGIGRLEAMIKSVEGSSHGNKTNLAAFLNYRLVTSQFSIALAEANALKKQAEKDKAQIAAMSGHIEALKAHIEKYPDADETPKAYNELATNLENDGSFDDAKKYYQQCAANFPNSINGKLAAGAVRRLDLVGSPVTLRGKTLDNKDWTPPKGKPYIIFYYSGQYTGIGDEVKALVEAETKGKKSDLKIVCVSLDATATDAAKFAKSSGIIDKKWSVLYADGGMEGKLAQDMGIFQAPYVIIVDKDGKGSWQGPGAREAANNLPK